MTIVYALLSITLAAISAALVWVASGPFWAALTYVGVGSIVLLGTAGLIAMREGSVLPTPRPLKADRNKVAG